MFVTIDNGGVRVTTSVEVKETPPSGSLQATLQALSGFATNTTTDNLQKCAALKLTGKEK